MKSEYQYMNTNVFQHSPIVFDPFTASSVHHVEAVRMSGCCRLVLETVEQAQKVKDKQYDITEVMKNNIWRGSR